MHTQALGACIRKELLLLSRDIHGLALLFLMPLAFIVIMSLALQNQFAERAGQPLKILSLDQDRSTASHALLTTLSDNTAFVLTPTPQLSPTAHEQALRQGQYAFAIRIEAGFATQLLSTPKHNTTALVTVTVAPDTSKQTEAIFIASLQAALGQQRLLALLNNFNNFGSDLTHTTDNTLTDQRADSNIAIRYAYTPDHSTIPSAVQQSVPAWLVFAVFFVVIPFSNTLIQERQLGTLRRLRSTHINLFTLLLGKLIPYFIINQLQVVLMLLAGCYLVPLLGGDALQLDGSLLMLACIASSLSVAALGCALLIAVTARTTEQATLLGGTGNIVLAALGGIMVPKFIMPPTLHTLAQWSPMSWGLEGFLDVLLRHGSWHDLAPEAAGLTTLGLIAILLATQLLRHRID